MVSRVSSLSGARPRLVWMMTPVALMTGRRVDCKRRFKFATVIAASWSTRGQGLPSRLAWRALSGEEESARGTALEYLAVVLPEDLRVSLRPWLGTTLAERPTKQRKADELLEELKATSGAGGYD